jgi:mitochondrial-processing peptidase subunit alpha
MEQNRPTPKIPKIKIIVTDRSIPPLLPTNPQGASIAVGMYVSSGSKWENPYVSGASHLLERMAWRSTANRTAFRVTREAEVIGANLLASASREQMAYTVDCLRTNLPEAVELLTDAVMNQKLADHEVADVAAELKKEMASLAENPAHLIMEAAHSVAFTGGLGSPLVATPSALTRLDGDALASFVQATYTAPRVVLAASGCDHDELVSAAEPLLSTLPPGPGAPSAPTTYVGGDYRVGTDSPLTNIILAFEFKGGWKDQKGSTAMTVLNTLMGGGGSFSAGGPGKGMYSRLYNRVLNKHAWAQNCTSFHSVFDDTGIIGISGVAEGMHAGDMVAVMAKELAAVANGKIDTKELARAKAQTVSSILMNLESRAVVAEDIGRQILTYGERKSPSEFIAAINALTAAEISAVAAEALKSNPTLCVVGDLTAAPRFEQVKALF